MDICANVIYLICSWDIYLLYHLLCNAFITLIIAIIKQTVEFINIRFGQRGCIGCEAGACDATAAGFFVECKGTCIENVKKTFNTVRIR